MSKSITNLMKRASIYTVFAAMAVVAAALLGVFPASERPKVPAAKQGANAFLPSAKQAGVIAPLERQNPEAARALPDLRKGKAASASPLVANRLVANYGKLPLSFEENHGQTDPSAKFLARGRGYALFLTGDEAVLALRKSSVVSSQSSVAGHSLPPLLSGRMPEKPKTATDNGPRTTDAVLHMRLVGANASAAVTGAEELPGKSNYFIGNDPKKWRTNVPNYAKVEYKEIYPGVDLVYYGNQQQLEYDFVLAPGADPSVVTLEVAADGLRPSKGERGSSLQIATDGDVVVKAKGGEVRFGKPLVYQPAIGHGQRTTDNGERTIVEGHYILTASNQVRFALGPYDHTRPLVIDPALVYSTYLGGSGNDQALGIAVDSSGNAYVTGSTNSPNFPTADAYQGTLGAEGAINAFVAKVSAGGNGLAYSTYLGGNSEDVGNGIAVDSSGNAYVAGYTYSADFPTTSGAFQASYQGSSDIFVTKLNATGNGLVYSTYLGGSGSNLYPSIAVDSSGDAYVAGTTTSTNFPTTANAFQTSNGGGYNVFVAKVNAEGTGLVYSTYLGGSSNDLYPSIAVDSSGYAYVTGETQSSNFPVTSGVFQGTINGSQDAFVTKLSLDGTGLVYSTFLGAAAAGFGIAVDSSGQAYVNGIISSKTFPATSGAFQTAIAGSSNAFVAKVSADGTTLVYFTYLGGNSNDIGYGIAVDPSGDAYVTGATNSTNFPTTANAPQSSNAGGEDAFVAELNPSGSALVYSTYLGGSGDDWGIGVALDASQNAYVAGYTNSTNFPTANALQGSWGGGNDAFVAELAPPPPPQPLSSAQDVPSVLTYNFGPYNFVVDYYGDTYYSGYSLNVTDMPTTQAQFKARVQTTGYANTTCSIFNGAGGNCVIFELTCQQARQTVTCPPPSNPDHAYTFTMNWGTPDDTSEWTYATTAFLKADITVSKGVVTEQNNWENILTYLSAGEPTGTGRTGPGYSDFVFVYKVPSSTAPTITINTPQSGAVYAANQTVLADYSCSDDSVVSCVGDVPPGSAIDTSCSGTTTCSKTFTVNATVSSGQGAVDSVGYQVNPSLQIPTVTFSAPPTAAYYETPSTVTATTNASTTATITASGVCTVTSASGAPSSPSPGTTTTATVTMTGSTGTCTLRAYWPEDATLNYGAASATYSIAASPAPLTITASGGSFTYGGTVPTITPGYSGFVGTDTAASLTVAPTCSTTATSTSPVSGNPYTSSCSGAADPNYTISYVNGTVTVNPAASTTTFSSTAPSQLPYNGTYTPAATTTGDGTLTIGANGACTILGGVVTITAGSGTCTVTATMAQGKNYLGSSATLQTITAVKAGSKTTITSNGPNPSAPGQAVLVSFSVTGNGSPTTTVTVSASPSGPTCTGTLNVAGAGSCWLTFYTVGSWTLTASYPGDSNFYGSTSAGVAQSVVGPLASVPPSPPGISFGTVYLGTITVKSVTVTNVGNAPMTITTPFFSILSGGTLSEFLALNLCPKSLAAGKSCTIEVSFIAGPYYAPQTATLNIIDSAYNSPQTVTLSATVINPQAWLSATSVRFSTVKAGSSSAPKVVTLKNTGATALAITSISIASADFMQTNTCPLSPAASLQAGYSCTISVTFTPTAKGSRSASVVITDNAQNSPQTISLSGTGD